MRRTGWPIVVALLVAAACGGDGDEPDTAVPTTTAPTTAAPTTAAPTTTAAPPETTAGEATTTASTTTTTTGGATTGIDPGATCSASDVGGEPNPQPELPDEVRQVRRDIFTAAVACDYDALARLAQTGDRPFTYSFGGGGDPAGHWRRLETEGNEPLRYLAEVLQRPYGRRTVEGVVTYEWPSAFTFDDWADVPEADREALRPLYGDEDFSFYEQFGGYIGYRVGITADGEWLFFVAGD